MSVESFTRSLTESSFETEEVDLPDWMASYLINGDASGMSDEEEALAVEAERAYGHCVGVSDEPFFQHARHIPGVGQVLGGNFLTYTFHKRDAAPVEPAAPAPGAPTV